MSEYDKLIDIIKTINAHLERMNELNEEMIKEIEKR